MGSWPSLPRPEKSWSWKALSPNEGRAPPVTPARCLATVSGKWEPRQSCVQPGRKELRSTAPLAPTAFRPLSYSDLLLPICPQLPPPLSHFTGSKPIFPSCLGLCPMTHGLTLCLLQEIHPTPTFHMEACSPRTHCSLTPASWLFTAVVICTHSSLSVSLPPPENTNLSGQASLSPLLTTGLQARNRD
jgi:hypothetical protein